MELFFEDPDREDERVLFEREDLPVVFLPVVFFERAVVFFERDFELELDFDDVRRFDPLPERLRVLLPPDPEPPLLLGMSSAPLLRLSRYLPFISSRVFRTSVASSPAAKPALPNSLAALPRALETDSRSPKLGFGRLPKLGFGRLTPRMNPLREPLRASAAPPARPARAAPPAIIGVFALLTTFVSVLWEPSFEPAARVARLVACFAPPRALVEPLRERPLAEPRELDRDLVEPRELDRDLVEPRELPPERLLELERRVFVWAILPSFRGEDLSPIPRGICFPDESRLPAALLPKPLPAKFRHRGDG